MNWIEILAKFTAKIKNVKLENSIALKVNHSVVMLVFTVFFNISCYKNMLNM